MQIEACFRLRSQYLSDCCRVSENEMQVFAELKDLASEIASVELVSPTLIVIGKVVALSPCWPFPTKEAASSCLAEVK